jgi:hypothetical protein
VLRWSEEENECFLFKKQRIYTKGRRRAARKDDQLDGRERDRKEREHEENIYKRKTEDNR